MKTLLYPEYGKLELKDCPLPVLAKHEVLIEVAACGICGSELESFGNQSKKRIPPIIMGHEFAGVIAALGEQVKDWAVGDRVLSNAVLSCGGCAYCKGGQTNICPKREVFSIHRNGAFAEYVNVPTSSLLIIPEQLPLHQACLTEPLANGVHMVSLTKNFAAERVLIIGAGPIGLLAMQAFIAIRKSRCVIADLKTERLEVGSSLGASLVVNPMADRANQVYKDFTEGQEFDIVVDAVGNAATTRAALDQVRSGGAVVLIGLQQDTSVLSSYELITKEKAVFGSYAATQEDMRTALNLIALGKVDVSSWVSYFGLDEGVEAFMATLNAKHIKTVIKIKQQE